jgi:diketogulonate reductase-like aldo/keto reductase
MPPTREAAIPTVMLNNGVRIPQLGFGLFQLPAEKTQCIVEDALEAGYRHIDTTAASRSEATVGTAIAASGISREELFISAMVPNGKQATVAKAFENSRAALKLDYLDLYLMPREVETQGPVAEGWVTMERLYADGQIRAAGVSNFMAEDLAMLLPGAVVVPAVNQIGIRPTQQQAELAAACRSLGIAVAASSPGGHLDLNEDTVRYLAAKYAATPAQIVLAWHLGSGTIATSSASGRFQEDVAAASITLNSGELAAIARLDNGLRTGVGPSTAAVSPMS